MKKHSAYIYVLASVSLGTVSTGHSLKRQMEMPGVKPELVGLARGHLCGAETVASEATKCVKRRRRDPFFTATAGSSKQGVLQGDQSVTAIATTMKRSSRFRGVSRHRWTGRFEAHLWDKGSWNVTQRKKGKQVYLGAYDEEESAARAYDLAALKYWGPSTFTNFPVSEYEKEIEIMQGLTKEEYLASLRRRSSGFSRGVSKYRGVARHHHNGRWEARIGRVFGNKYLYLGTYSTQEEAAHAYDIAAIEYRGINAVTNFDLSTYIRRLRPKVTALTSRELVSNSQPMQPSSNCLSNPDEDLSFLSPIPFAVGGLATPLKQGKFQTEVSFSPYTYSSNSTTALSLLHRSSAFRQLVEKNSNPTE